MSNKFEDKALFLLTTYYSSLITGFRQRLSLPVAVDRSELLLAFRVSSRRRRVVVDRSLVFVTIHNQRR